MRRSSAVDSQESEITKNRGDAVPAVFTRRAFCAQACGAASLASVASMLQACGGSPTSPSDAPGLPTINGSVTNRVVSVSIDPGSPLATVGNAALVQTTAGSFLVARTAQSTFTALTAVCTHEGCTVTGFESQTYVCPCHGSRFNTAGGVTAGPATRALQSFATQFANNVLTFTT